MSTYHTNTYKKGLFAEKLSAWALRLKGYRILARRFRTPFGEVDLIVKRGTILAFVEVKARPSLEQGLESISLKQQKRIVQAAQFFISHKRRIPFESMRFDMMYVGPRKWPQHFKNAWYPDD